MNMDFRAALLWPEMILLALIVVVMMFDMLLPREKRSRLLPLSAISLGALLVAMALIGRPVGDTMALHGQWTVDAFAWVMKLFLVGVLLSIVIVTTPWTKRIASHLGAHLILVLSSGLGMMVMVSANDLILLFVGLELATIPLMILTALDRRSGAGNEAAVKFVITGSVASAFSIFGIALIWGFSGGELKMDALREFVARGNIPPAYVIGTVLLFAGLGFKTAIAPFHVWVPDVYQGAPTPITAFLAGGSKAAGFAALTRVGVSLFRVPPEMFDWATVLAFLAALTAIVGNMGAMWQRDLKRLLAHASVGHAGFLLMGLAVVGSGAGIEGLTALFYYLIFYAVAVASVFFIMGVASRSGVGDQLSDYDGFSRRSPMMAFGLLLAVMSMGGIPLTAGFVGKFWIVSFTWKAHFYWLAAAATFSIVLSIVYSLMILRSVFIAPGRKDLEPIPAKGWEIAFVLVLGLGMVAFGAYPTPVTHALESAMTTLVNGGLTVVP